MSNLNLEIEVIETMEGFVQDNQPFTALDVSNKIKETYPEVRHSQVRELVKKYHATNQLFTNYNWTRSLINVSLEDGSTTETWLYHFVGDVWDLDAKYDKRSQKSNKVVKPAVVNAAPITVNTPVVPLVVPATVGTVPSDLKKDLSNDDFKLIFSASKDNFDEEVEVVSKDQGSCDDCHCDNHVNTSLFEDLSKDLETVKESLEKNKNNFLSALKGLIWGK